jgi:DNA-binding CsgD family transcriptional regulator
MIEAAGGNPLALVELAEGRLAIEPDALSAAGNGGGSALERSYGAMLNGLGEDTRLALELVAADASGSLPVVAGALGALGVDPAAIEDARRRRLVEVDGSKISFHHPLMRSVVLRRADSGRLRAAHEALAGRVPDPDRRAWHLAAATAVPDEVAAGELEASAGRAMERGAAASAARAWERAAELSPEESDRYRRLAAAARAAHRAGDLPMTATLLASARQGRPAAADPALVLVEADLRMRGGDFTAARRFLLDQAARLAPAEPRLAATMLLLAAKVRVYRFEAARALEEVRSALALAAADDVAELVQLAALGMTETMAGSPTASAVVERTMAAAIGAPNGHTHTLAVGWPLVWMEEYGQARSFLDRSISVQREGGFLAYLPQTLLAAAELDFRTGRWPAARAGAEEAGHLFEELGQPPEAAIAAALLARLDAAEGDAAGAKDRASKALASDTAFGLRAASAFAEAALGLLELGRGAHDEAVAHLRQVEAIAEAGEIGEPWLLPYQADLGEALVRASRRREGGAVGRQLEERGRALGRLSAIAAGLRIRGMLAAEGEFRSLMEEALEIHSQLPTPFDTARTELCMGERLRRGRDRVEARLHLRRALAVFEGLGAEPWAARARSELAASGEVRSGGNGASLTPQERQVAAMVAGGATNRETAAALFVSPKTIEFHLGNVYRKLGVRSRTELANALPRSDAAG